MGKQLLFKNMEIKVKTIIDTGYSAWKKSLDARMAKGALRRAQLELLTLNSQTI